MAGIFFDQLQRCHDVKAVAGWLLQRGIAVTGAPMGNVQIMNWRSGALAIAAQTGFDDPFLNFFRSVRLNEASVCAQALARRQAVTVEDVCREDLRGPCDAIFAAAAVRAVQSFPLISDNDALMGMVSTHFSQPWTLEPSRCAEMLRLARMAANRLVVLSAEGNSYQMSIRQSQIRMTEARQAIAAADRLLARDPNTRHLL